MTVPPGAKITKDCMGNFSHPIFFTVEGRQIASDVTSRKKKDLPRSLEYMQKRVDKGSLTVTLHESGRIESVCYPLFWELKGNRQSFKPGNKKKKKDLTRRKNRSKVKDKPITTMDANNKEITRLRKLCQEARKEKNDDVIEYCIRAAKQQASKIEVFGGYISNRNLEFTNTGL